MGETELTTRTELTTNNEASNTLVNVIVYVKNSLAEEKFKLWEVLGRSESEFNREPLFYREAHFNKTKGFFPLDIHDVIFVSVSLICMDFNRTTE